MKKIVILKWSSFIVLIIILLCGVYYYFFLNDWQRGFLERSLQYTSFNKSEYETKGLDFSHHNGRLDWGKLKDARKSHNINFMIFKATEGNTFKDSYYTKNIHNARKYGYICGAYHFFIPWIPSVLQAHNYISHAKLQKGDLPPIVDVEREAMVMSRHRIQETLLSLLKQLEKEFGT